MSTIQTSDKWNKLCNLFQAMNPEIEETIKTKLNVKEVCVDGLARSTGATRSFSQMLTRMGFSEKECSQARSCVVTGCPFSADIYNMLNHYIGYHKTPIRSVAKFIAIMKSDTRKPDTSLKTSIQTSHMRTD
jgi:hypothetical protein